ncbi:heavy-metal-associated domain-containing protein [Gordonia sp. zg691]|uniref:Heavy-metal-associated domain-containing protein n=1 Tax=Gordonia jinghuaiqii TaxID=2758710 RepID=A0A7D7R2P5_9ACTN|nr:heavy metal-associated domain-containing protein [Gordonia jinghuaiqii]MBD0860604.1 heavy-metal-associated domain-containing protein [Gordonia jinghuaiqii]MCR5978131.1 cation-transporting ATPase [Gordonia jinghuaiqii]QMT01412.1 heavy-metal-associated domain-containing protein [Gordonia jinghuaiqii]
MSTTSEYTVTGMTCGHCVASVREEIEALPGVTAVDVTLADGSVRVDADRELGRDEVETAVAEAGYALA